MQYRLHSTEFFLRTLFSLFLFFCFGNEQYNSTMLDTSKFIQNSLFCSTLTSLHYMYTILHLIYCINFLFIFFLHNRNLAFIRSIQRVSIFPSHKKKIYFLSVKLKTYFRMNFSFGIISFSVNVTESSQQYTKYVINIFEIRNLLIFLVFFIKRNHTPNKKSI